MNIYRNAGEAIKFSVKKLLSGLSYTVDNNNWQGTKVSDKPEANRMREFLNLYFQVYMPETKEELQEQMGMKSGGTIWAEEHFQERISGEPLNPPPSYIKWHNGGSGDYMQNGTNIFNHTYPERMWWNKCIEKGLRYKNGNLFSIIEILRKDPNSRQAFMPMFIHEDLTAALVGDRVPCSLGWNFIQRHGYMHLNYSLRSCDAARHFVNDVYMAIRLAQWVRNHAFGDKVKMGFLYFNAISFHCFENDVYTLKQKYEKK